MFLLSPDDVRLKEVLMQYTWRDKKTSAEVIVDRKVKDSDVPPRVAEAVEQGMDIKEASEAEWEKIITGGAGHIGFGMKGHW